MPFDEEELDPHGGCAAEIARLRKALTEIQTLAVASGAALTWTSMNSAHTQIDKITRAALAAQ